MEIGDLESLTDAQISNYQRALGAEENRRLRVAAIPAQIRDLIVDARRGGELSEREIRDAFESAMSADIGV